MTAVPFLVFFLINKVLFLSGMFSTSLKALFSSVSGAVLLGALWTLHHSYSHDDLTFLLETKMCAHAAREWKLTDCTELGRSSCSSLLTGAGTGCVSLSAEPVSTCLCIVSDASSLPVPFSILMTSMQSKKAAFFLCLVSVVGKVWSNTDPLYQHFCKSPASGTAYSKSTDNALCLTHPPFNILEQEMEQLFGVPNESAVQTGSLLPGALSVLLVLTLC